MPYQGGCNSISSDVSSQQKIDKLTRMLCFVMRNSKAKEFYRIETGDDKIYAELAQWWDEHQEIDRKRQEKEKRIKEEKAVKQYALGKLTKKERKLLGLE